MALLLRSQTRRASPITTVFHRNPSLMAPHLTTQPSAKNDFHRDYMASPDSGTKASSFFRRFLHRPAQHPSSTRLSDLLSFPVGDRLRDRLKGMAQPRLNLDSVLPPSPPGISVEEARKLLRICQAARVKDALREIPGNAIGHRDYVRVCVEQCSNNEEQGRELAKLMDEWGDVIVFGSLVFTRPDQVVKRIQDLVSQSVAAPDDPRRRELEEMGRQKAAIDKKASSLVRGELYCGLGLMVLQALGLMRLTFWELSWDVMEPICFFVTSLHFAAGYAFFLHTSTEPSFQGFYRRRFKVKQMKVMQAEGFDMAKYDELCRVFHHNCETHFVDQQCGGQ
uniref:Calcium uniporter protein C-terminal domain-containing protein n=1 Tax=Kalanchoe fedtschenkoi TaxID=63787 RepID=A0A7N0UPE1_KALFE